jgi:hypothetical protein
MEYYTPTFIKKNMDAIKRIRELHTPTTASGCGDPECCSLSDSEEFCSECQNYEYPCNTIKALNGK